MYFGLYVWGAYKAEGDVDHKGFGGQPKEPSSAQRGPGQQGQNHPTNSEYKVTLKVGFHNS